MLENCKNAKERWGGVSTIIDRWLQERQELIVSLCTLSGLDEFDEKNSDHSQQVRYFCQTLMDYISAGHFEIYDQLIKEGREFEDTEGLKTATELYRVVDITTGFLLDFNDKYQETDDLSSLSHDLSQVGQHLESRFEAEDQMITVLHDSHKTMVV